MNVDGMTSDQSALVERLMRQLDQKAERNALRSLYYDARMTPQALGMSMPPAVANRIRAVLGWPAKAVDTLAARVYWQGFFAEDSGQQSFANEIAEANRLESELPQAFISAFEHSVSFLVATKGEDGEPAAVVTAKDALNGTGEWDPRRRSLSSFLSVLEREGAKPTQMALHEPGRVTEIVGEGTTWEVAGVQKNDVDGLAVEPLANKPRLGRPFGRSRITRPVMSITDMAVRTVIRSEVGAEFYAIPQRWLMGANEAAFSSDGSRGDTWRILVGRIMALDDDDKKRNPRAQVGQFPQASQQPHMDQLRALAQLFSGETSIPVSSLGISIDSNPTSADSYAASREDVIAEAEAVIRDWRGATSRILSHASVLAGRGPVSALSRFRDPRYTSRAAAADAVVKSASVLPWMAESDVVVEMLGYDEVTTARLLAEKRRAQARAMATSLASLVPQDSGGDAG